MPTREQHLTQARRNETLVDELQQPGSDGYPDWCTTIAFYAVVHYVEAYLAPDRHSANHKARNAYLGAELPLLWPNYRALMNASQRSRYFLTWRSEELVPALEDLRVIRTYPAHQRGW